MRITSSHGPRKNTLTNVSTTASAFGSGRYEGGSPIQIVTPSTADHGSTAAISDARSAGQGEGHDEPANPVLRPQPETGSHDPRRSHRAGFTVPPGRRTRWCLPGRGQVRSGRDGRRSRAHARNATGRPSGNHKRPVIGRVTAGHKHELRGRNLWAAFGVATCRVTMLDGPASRARQAFFTRPPHGSGFTGKEEAPTMGSSDRGGV